MVPGGTRFLTIVIASVILVTTTIAPTAVADHEYEQPVLFTWYTMKLNVLVAGVDDPLIGAAIKEGITAWETGIQQSAPDWLANEFELRVYFPGHDPVPPQGWDPLAIHIYVVPQGAQAVTPPGSYCVVAAPMVTGYGPYYHIVLHEFGHCLGLGHVFNHGQEYSPAFDPMGSGEPGHHACPSNLNIAVLELVYSGRQGTVTMPASEYYQSEC